MIELRRRIMVSAGGAPVPQNFVDLGLPSGLLWAICNVGASNPEESGLYYSWGNAEEIDTTKNYGQSNYNALPGASLTGDIPQNATYDAAFANSGGQSRIPTETEFTELINNTVSEWGTLNGINGRYYYKKVNGQKVSDTYIFIPASGRYNTSYVQYSGEQLYYWTATYIDANQGRRINATNSSAGAAAGANKWFGFSIRGVHRDILVDFVDLGLPSGLLWAKGNLCKDSQGNYYIGAETDYGTYASWGNIDGYNDSDGYNFSSTNYNSTAGKSVSGDIPSNDATHDIAFARLGTPWHLPTKENFQEMYDNTDSERTTINGITGHKFMKKSDHSVYVFLPSSGRYYDTNIQNSSNGYYWSSSYDSSSSAYLLLFSSYSFNPQYHNVDRAYGLTVRPVCNP